MRFDIIIIGFGKGGKTVAGALAAAGRQVALIEQSAAMYGGTCINVGCIPSKSLVTSAKLSASQGGSLADKAQRYAAAVEEKRRLTAMLRKKNFDKLDTAKNCTVITGKARFTAPGRVQVRTGEKTLELESAQILINTGASPFIPPIPGLLESRYIHTSESLLDLDALPQRLVIIGGGYIGMEFASMYQNFGSKVTVVQNEAVFLPREDREIADAVRAHLESRGVELLFSAGVEKTEDTPEHAVVTVRTESGIKELAAQAVLVATGRRPNVQELNLSAAGIELTPRGAVKTDALLRTTAPGVWALGDVTGGLQFTYISLDDSRVVLPQLLGTQDEPARTTVSRGAVPYSVFLDPPFSRVGLSEQEAREAGYEVKIARLPAAAIPKAQVLRETAGLLKAVVDAKSGRILGAHLFCAESHEVINLLKLAMDAGLSYTTLRDSIYTHPTMSEALGDLFATV